MEGTSDNHRFMDYLLFRSLKSDTTATEEETVIEWRNASPENEAHYLELARLLALTADAHRPSDEEVGPPPRSAEIVRLVESGAAMTGHKTDRTLLFARKLRWRWRLTIGLSAAAAAVLVVLTLQRPVSTPEDMLSFGVDEFVTGSKDLATVQLRDGTIVRLAPESRLRLSGSPGERVVTLAGLAFFAVAKMEGHPFTVRAGGGDAVVLGTRFEAEARGDELRVMVVEGRVALAAPGNRIELGAGEMARAVEGAVSSPVKVPDPQQMLEWTGNFLVFQRTPIDEVAAEIEQHFTFPVRVIGDDYARHTVTAWFADPTPEEVLQVVCKVLAARCSVKDRAATIDLTKPAS